MYLVSLLLNSGSGADAGLSTLLSGNLLGDLFLSLSLGGLCVRLLSGLGLRGTSLLGLLDSLLDAGSLDNLWLGGLSLRCALLGDLLGGLALRLGGLLLGLGGSWGWGSGGWGGSDNLLGLDDLLVGNSLFSGSLWLLGTSGLLGGHLLDGLGDGGVGWLSSSGGLLSDGSLWHL